MLLQLFIVFVVDVDGLGTVKLADVAKVVTGVEEVSAEGVEVVVVCLTELAEGVIQDQLAGVRDFTVLEVVFQVVLCEEVQLRQQAILVVQTHLAESATAYQNCRRWHSLRCLFR